jgi:hypothetical protein
MPLAIPRHGYNSSVHLGCGHMNTIIQLLPVDDQFETGSLYLHESCFLIFYRIRHIISLITTTLSQRPISSNISKLSYEPCRAAQYKQQSTTSGLWESSSCLAWSLSISLSPHARLHLFNSINSSAGVAHLFRSHPFVVSCADHRSASTQHDMAMGFLCLLAFGGCFILMAESVLTSERC